jgi:hypothetical protein
VSQAWTVCVALVGNPCISFHLLRMSCQAGWDGCSKHNVFGGVAKSRAGEIDDAINEAVDNLIYIIGGRAGVGRSSFNIDLVEEYNPATDQWLLRAPMPTPRSAAAWCVYGGMFMWPVARSGIAITGPHMRPSKRSIQSAICGYDIPRCRCPGTDWLRFYRQSFPSGERLSAVRHEYTRACYKHRSA